MEEALLEVIGAEATGLLNIPQGGMFNKPRERDERSDIIPEAESCHMSKSGHTVQGMASGSSTPMETKRVLCALI